MAAEDRGRARAARGAATASDAGWLSWGPAATRSGTHTGEFQRLPPTRNNVSFSGLELNRFVEGRVAEHWFQLDT